MDADQIVDYDSLEYISDVNLVLFHSKEFLAVYRGESAYEVLPNGVHTQAVKHGLITRYSYPSTQRLTEKAIKILRDHKLCMGI